MAMILSQTQANTTMELIKNITTEKKSIDSPVSIDVQRKRDFFLGSQKKKNTQEVPL